MYFVCKRDRLIVVLMGDKKLFPKPNKKITKYHFVT